jgi:hypothetical protein
MLSFFLMKAVSLPLPAEVVFPVEQIPLMLALYFLGAIPEEFGWTMTVTSPMTKALGPIQAGMIIGGVWALWHVIPWGPEAFEHERLFVIPLHQHWQLERLWFALPKPGFNLCQVFLLVQRQPSGSPIYRLLTLFTGLADPAVPLFRTEPRQNWKQHCPAQPEIDEQVSQLQPVVMSERAPVTLWVDYRDEWLVQK